MATPFNFWICHNHTSNRSSHSSLENKITFYSHVICQVSDKKNCDTGGKVMTTAHVHSTKPGHGLSTSSNPIQAQELYMKVGRVLENDLENQKKAEYFSVIFLSKT